MLIWPFGRLVWRYVLVSSCVIRRTGVEVPLVPSHLGNCRLMFIGGASVARHGVGEVE
jgi:hypothetical protein